MVEEKETVVFISYLDDDNKQINTYVTLIRMSDSLIVFRTKQNTITIPISRLIKLKQEVKED